jgi:hypothetical protein
MYNYFVLTMLSAVRLAAPSASVPGSHGGICARRPVTNQRSPVPLKRLSARGM